MELSKKYYSLVTPKIEPKITLTEKEKEIFNIFLETLDKNSSSAVLRVAGGWVRDKLMGKESDDIDIAIDSMYGEDLAKMVYSNCQIDKRIGIVESNPDQSKHLKTAIIRLCDVSIDLVNLRSESYSDNSRIPEQKIGTPLEDAQRRDLTINSLFYNINEGKIEDFLEKGLEDLKNGVIRTPLEPWQTFVDDPLRIMRVIRFACRFNFKIESSILEAFKNAELKDHLRNKISNERIKKELDSTFTGPEPSAAVAILQDYDLLETCLKTDCETKEIHQECVKIAENINILLKKGVFDCIIKQEYKDFKRNLFYLALTVPFRNIQRKIKKKEVPLSLLICKENLKLSNETSNLVQNFCFFLDKFVETAEGNQNRAAAGITVREVSAENLAYFFIYACAQETSRGGKETVLFEFFKFLTEQQLLDWSKKKVFVTGEDLRKTFNLKPGKRFKEILDEIERIQLENPSFSREDMLEQTKTLI